MAGEDKARIEHGEQVVAGDGVVVVGLCKLAHGVLAIGWVNVDHINLATILDEEVEEGVIVVADDELVSEGVFVLHKT